jgi:hypothetical protein
MVRNLHSRFDHFDESLKELHRDHVALRDRVDIVEREVASDIAHLDKHESEACLRESKILLRLDTMTTVQTKQHEAFVEHASREDQDRRWIRNVLTMTLLGVLGTLGLMLLNHMLGGAV